MDKLQPHRQKMWLPSHDDELRAQRDDVLHVYDDTPPDEHIICLDEVRGLQILERLCPDIPMAPAMPVRRAFEYKRHGSLTLMGALDVRRGKVCATWTWAGPTGEHEARSRRSCDSPGQPRRHPHAHAPRPTTHAPPVTRTRTPPMVRRPARFPMTSSTLTASPASWPRSPQRFAESRGECAQVAAAGNLLLAMDIGPRHDAEKLQGVASRVSAMLTGLMERLS